MASYTVGLYDYDGNFLRPIDWMNLQYARARRTVGALTLTVSDRYPEAIFGRDAILRLYRRAIGGPRYLEPAAIWFVRKVTHNWKENTLTISCVDQMTFLERRRVAYRSQSLYADKTFDEGNAPAPADDLMKAYVRENLGADAVEESTGNPDPARDLSAYLTVEEDRSMAPDVEYTGSQQKVIDVLNGLARESEDAGTILFFDIVTTGPKTFEFKTFPLTATADRRDALTFTTNGGNLDELVSEIDYSNEITVVNVGGDSSGATKYVRRVVSDRATITPFNWIEDYYDANEDYADDYLDQIGRRILQAGLPKKKLRANLVDSQERRYGRDYFYGDYINVEMGGDIFNCLITAINNSITDGKEQLSIQLEGELAVV